MFFSSFIALILVWLKTDKQRQGQLTLKVNGIADTLINLRICAGSSWCLLTGYSLCKWVII